MDVVHPDDKKTPLPFSYKVNGQLQPGSVIHIHGKIANPAIRVEFHFLEGFTGASAGQTIFHVSMRFDDPAIVMNSRINGSWGTEERQPNVFKAGMPFDVKIRVTNDFMEVYCANSSMHQFKHRLPFAQVHFIECDGEATLNGFHYAESCSVDTLPHTRNFPSGCLQYNQHVIIYGIATGDNWTVELTGSGGNALFQLIAKYKEKVVTRNANIGGNWGQEERTGQFPYQRDRGFDLSIANLPSGLQVLCNNARFTVFPHRTGAPISDYTGLKIEGDARIVMVRVAP